MQRHHYVPFVALLVTLAALPQGARSQDVSLAGSLTVFGTGENTARPDTAEVQAGVITEAQTAREALKINATAMTTLVKSLTAFAIADSDLQTTAFGVTPLYARDSRGTQPAQPPGQVAYRVENRLHITVREISRLGELLDTLVAQGANTVYGVQFRVGTPQTLIDQARLAAVEDAQRKAALYAQATQSTLGRVLSLREESGSPPPPQPFGARALAAEAPVPVSPGEMLLTVRVVVTYELVR